MSGTTDVAMLRQSPFQVSVLQQVEGPMHIYVHAERTPEKPALQMAASGLTVTYRELEERSNQVAQMLRALGLRTGDHIAILMENHPRFFDVCWGAQRAGIIYTAISTRLTAGEAAYIIGDCGAKLLVTSRAMAALAADLREKTPSVGTWLMVDGVLDGYDSFEAQVSLCPVARITDESAGGDMLYSSGTTGQPKGVFVPPMALEIDAVTPLMKFCKSFGLNEDSAYLSPAPLYHAAPLRFSLNAQRFGGTVIVMEHFDAEELLRLIEVHRVTHTQVVPTMFVRMLKLDADVRSQYDVSSLRCAIHAAAPCPVPIKEQMIGWWGPIIWEYYGGTESNGITLVDSTEWLSHKGTVGRSVLGSVKICGADGAELPVGQTGSVYFADGPVFEYHNDPIKTADSRNSQGWSTLGDIGYVDADGYLYLTDRKAYMIISGGVNVYPQECENLLVTHPSVLDVAVFGVPNEDLGEEVKAVVQPRDMREAGSELEHELIAFCRQHLSAIKCPKSIDFEAELPRHPTGKLYKRLLRDRYWTSEPRSAVDSRNAASMIA
jgi:long-chain acyl-CoA synthetase